jgi:hypothetical protein
MSSIVYMMLNENLKVDFDVSEFDLVLKAVLHVVPSWFFALRPENDSSRRLLDALR